MESIIKKLPVGIEQFQDIRTEGFYYVDKTGFIKEILDSWGKVNLFTRPRRFGKSLNMSMLKAFFEIGTEPSLFDGLEIAAHTALCEAYLGQFPVICVSLKDVDGTDYQAAYDMLGVMLNEEALRLQWLMESDRLTEYDKKQMRRLLEEDFAKTSSVTGGLKLLSRLLYQHYGKKVIVLIDEYDVPLDKAYENGYYEKMVKLIRSLFSQVLKSNDYLHFAVITGCLRIAKESIFTGLNNFRVRTISDVDYAEYFGFTNQEVKDMLAYYGLEEQFDTMKEWYDGYRFGKVEVYCPWDVVNHCDKLRTSRETMPEAYWANSSSNAIVRSIIEQSTATTRNEIETLLSGGIIEKELVPELTYTDLDSRDINVRQTYLWSVLFTTGYLTEADRPAGSLHRLVIPNREIQEIFQKQVRTWFSAKVMGDTERWKNFCQAIKVGEAERFQTIFNEFMADSISIRDTFAKKEMKENFYHGMLLGLLRAQDSWVVRSNAESGVGYTDILLELPSEKTGCIIEVKYAENGAFDPACAGAMKQIEDCSYTALLRQDGMEMIHAYGVACYKKTCRISYKKYV